MDFTNSAIADRFTAGAYLEKVVGRTDMKRTLDSIERWSIHFDVEEALAQFVGSERVLEELGVGDGPVDCVDYSALTRKRSLSHRERVAPRSASPTGRSTKKSAG